MFRTRFNLDTREFNRTLQEYTRHSRRAISEIVNNKAYFITVQAERLTPRVTPERIKHELAAGEVTLLKVLTSGKRKGQFSRDKKRNRTYAFGGTLDVENQRIFRILKAQYLKAGKTPPEGEELRKAALKMLGARIRSTAYIASGWLPAIFKLARARGKPPRYSRASLQHFAKSAKAMRKLGGASPSLGFFNRWSAVATIWNSAWTRRDPQALFRVAEPPLRAAFDIEAASMRQYIADKMARAAELARIKLQGAPPVISDPV